MHSNGSLLQLFRYRANKLGIVLRQDLTCCFYDRNLRSHLGKGHSQLEPDIAAANNHQLFRQHLEAERIGGGYHLATKGQVWKFDRFGTCGNHQVFCADDLHPGFGFHRDRLAVAKRSATVNDFDAGFLQQRADAAGQAPDNAVLPGHRPCKVDRHAIDLDAEGAATIKQAAGGVEFISRMDERLGWNAADIEAGPARLPGLDDHRVDAELSGADGADVAPGTGTDDKQLADDVFHDAQLSMKISAGVSSRTRMCCMNVAASKPSMMR
jgi:hypothetical protein